MDFMSDQLSSGRRIRQFNVIDDFTRQCLAIIADISINSQRVARELTWLIDLYDRPEFIICDNGTEHTSLVMFGWAQRSGVGLQLFNPASQARTGWRWSHEPVMHNHYLLSGARLGRTSGSEYKKTKDLVLLLTQYSWCDVNKGHREHSSLLDLFPFRLLSLKHSS